MRYLVNGCPSASRSYKEWTWEKECSPECGRFLFFLGVARTEWHAFDLTNFGKVVTKHDVSQFVCYVAVLAANAPERTDDDNRPIPYLECRCGESERLFITRGNVDWRYQLDAVHKAKAQIADRRAIDYHRAFTATSAQRTKWWMRLWRRSS